MQRTRPHLGMIALAAAAGVAAPLAEMKIVLRNPEPVEPPAPQQTRSASPASNRVYKPNGKREMERRRRQMARTENP